MREDNWENVHKNVKKYKTQFANYYQSIESLLGNEDYKTYSDKEIIQLSLNFKGFFSTIEKLLNGQSLPLELRKAIEILSQRINYLYERAALEISQHILEKTIDVSEKTNKMQSVQFTTFSIFLTILSFVLSNVILIAKELTKDVIIFCNLSILLFASVLFAFIGVFFNLPYSSETKAVKIIKYVILIGFPILIFALIIYFSNAL